jgi:hypothetical protein
MSNTKEEKEFMEMAYSNEGLRGVSLQIASDDNLHLIKFSLNLINGKIKKLFIYSLARQNNGYNIFNDMGIATIKLHTGATLEFSNLHCSDVYHYTAMDICEITADFKIKSSDDTNIEFLSGDICLSIRDEQLRTDRYSYSSAINYDNYIYNDDHYEGCDSIDYKTAYAVSDNCTIILALLRTAMEDIENLPPL